MKNIVPVEFYFSDEYVDWFKCTKCKCNRLVYKSNYCPNCGCQLDWDNCDWDISDFFP